MIKYLADKMTDFVCTHIKTQPDMADVYRYGFEITISSILNVILVLCCGIIIRDIWASVIYLSVFIFTRLFTGGYHATNYLRCNIAMVAAFLCTYALYALLIWLNTEIRIIEAILLANGLPIVIFAPVQNPHKKLTPQNLKKLQTLSIAVYAFISLAALTAVLFEIKYGTLMILTLTTVSVMILVEIFMQRRGFHES